MNVRQIGTVFAKELRDSVRDRRTLFSMLVFPAVIMPALMFGFGLVSFRLVKKAAAEIPAVMLIGREHSPALGDLMAASPRIRLVPAAADYADQISNKQIRAALEIRPGFDAEIAQGRPAEVKLYTYEGEMKSGFAAGEVERLLREHRDTMINRSLAERGLPGTLVRPFEIKRQNVAPPEKVGGNLIGGFIPYMLILLCVIGAMYPAIDLTAGEKERGTLETILCSPVGRVELVLGKFLTVLTISLFTVLVSIAALALSGVGLAAMLSRSATGVSGMLTGPSTMPMVHPLGVLGLLFMVVPLAVLFSALLFTTSLFAKSHKEAQTYTSPVLIVTLFPAMAAMLPGVELNAKMALVPVLNVALVGKEMVSGTFHPGLIAVIFLSSCFYGALALALAVRLFNRENVLFRT